MNHTGPEHVTGEGWHCPACALHCYCEFNGDASLIYTEDDLNEACVMCVTEYNTTQADALEGVEWL